MTSGAPDLPDIMPVPEDQAERVRAALDATCDALGLAARECAGGQRHWAALGLVTALQSALVAALSGYDTASPDAVLNPSQPERIAPVTQLLRRARSQEFLNPPERVTLSRAAQRAVERLIAVRNTAVHALSPYIPDSFTADARAVLALIRHLVVEAPAFAAPRNDHRVPDIARALTQLERHFAG